MHGKPLKQFEDQELGALLDKDLCQMQHDLIVALNVTQQWFLDDYKQWES